MRKYLALTSAELNTHKPSYLTEYDDCFNRVTFIPYE